MISTENNRPSPKRVLRKKGLHVSLPGAMPAHCSLLSLELPGVFSKFKRSLLAVGPSFCYPVQVESCMLLAGGLTLLLSPGMFRLLTVLVRAGIGMSLVLLVDLHLSLWPITVQGS